jgi:5-formyltetrahydrofolate cyclo-ligase
MNKNQIRHTLRAKRRSLNVFQQSVASRQLCKQIIQHPLFRASRHIALYLPNDGEIDPSPLIKAIKRNHKHCYLPVIQKNKTLRFALYSHGSSLVKNNFGIPEPANQSKARKAQLMDLVLMPLVAFDPSGGRLGMGGGFYDRTFAFKCKQNHRSPPMLIGLAHHFQEQDKLPVEAWDIPLNGIFTDKSFKKLS